LPVQSLYAPYEDNMKKPPVTISRYDAIKFGVDLTGWIPNPASDHYTAAIGTPE
jgi:hypothetical protein